MMGWERSLKVTLQTPSTENFPLELMGGQAEGLACADLVVRTPFGASGNYNSFSTVDSLLVNTVICHHKKFMYSQKKALLNCIKREQ